MTIGIVQDVTEKMPNLENEKDKKIEAAPKPDNPTNGKPDSGKGEPKVSGPELLFEPPKIDPKTVEFAKKIGVDLTGLYAVGDKLNQFYQLHQVQMKEIHDAFGKLDVILRPLAEQQQQAKKMAQTQQQNTGIQPQQQQAGQQMDWMGLIKEGSKLLMGTDSQPTTFDALMRQEMLSSWRSEKDFARTFYKMSLAKMAGAEAKDLMKMLTL